MKDFREAEHDTEFQKNGTFNNLELDKNICGASGKVELVSPTLRLKIGIVNKIPYVLDDIIQYLNI